MGSNKLLNNADYFMIKAPSTALPITTRQKKRAVDLAIVIPSLILSAPLFLIIALLVRFSSGSPVLFRQKRVGEGGQTFNMYKFRTMVNGSDKFDPERYDERNHKVADDPRVTRIGRFLRKTSLDELPQLYNVLRGDMSMVGPRPELPWIVATYQPWQLERLAVPQGITGWWQINGRSKNPMHLNVEFDVYYVRNHSLTLDLLILLRTPFVVLLGIGAF